MELTEDELRPLVERTEEKTEPKEAKNPRKRVRGHALTRLCKDSANTVLEKSSELVESLYKGALEGNVSCAKLLVALIEKLPPPKPRRKKQRSIALELANCPPWTGPLPSEMDDLEDQDDQFELS